MSKLSYVIAKLLNDKKFRQSFVLRRCSFMMSDRTYLEKLFPISLGYPLNLNNPRTYNEKIQWLKLYNKNPLYTKLVDKYAVKEWVCKKIGEQYIIPSLGVWSDAREIDFKSLPEQFVLKTTHDGGGNGVIVCKNKNQLDIKKTVKQLNKCIRHNHSSSSKEWVYDGVPHRIIAEQYMEDTETKELRDYKFFCFDGVVKALFVATDRGTGHVKFDYFDSDFNRLELKQSHPNSTIIIEKPKCFEEMKRVAEVLSEGIPHVRVDLYEADGKVYFGEMTFFHYSGLTPFYPHEWDETFGEWITLPQ